MSRNAWRPVMRSAKLGRKPVRVMLDGEALVVFRTPEGVACLRDMCPHRGASLSKGRVVDGTVECPYHGWRFGSTGECALVPVWEGETPRRRVGRWDVRESHGLVFVTKDADAAGPIPLPVWDGQPMVRRIIESDSISGLGDIVENVMDPIHTLFVHKGVIRTGSDEEEKKTRIVLSAGIEDGTVVMRYSGEEKQDGLLSRLLEGRRSHAINRFSMPGVVSLEYWGPERLNLVTTLYLTNQSGSSWKGFAVLTGPRQGGFGYLKALALVPIMRLVISQDRAVMKDAHDNWNAAGKPPYALSPLDLVRPLIDAVIAGEDADVPAREIEMRL